jgi:hypothetical protein
VLQVVLFLALEFIFGVQGRSTFERSSSSLLSTVVEIVESSLEIVFGLGARLRLFAGFVVFYLWCVTFDLTVSVY